jgi:hypothetical protein
MEGRGDPAAARAGDRVEYVRVAGDAIEDPQHALRHALAIDLDWYLHKQLKEPLLKLFEPLMPRPEAERRLFSGALQSAASARVVQVHRPQSGMMARFVTAAVRCLHCNKPLARGAAASGVSGGTGVLCSVCLPARDELLDCAQTEVRLTTPSNDTDAPQQRQQCIMCNGVRIART